MADLGSHDDYRRGFIEGFKSARGNDVADPEIPAAPDVPNDRKAYDIGWHDGRLHGLDATVPDNPE